MKKIVVLYDSVYGNTEKIARAIGHTLNAKIMSVAQADNLLLKNTNLLIVGSPVHGGRATLALEEFIKNLSRDALTGIKVAAFDTRFASEDHGIGIRILMSVIRYAAERIAKDLTKKGGILVAKPEGFIVKDKEGPLKDAELERAMQWAKEVSIHG